MEPERCDTTDNLGRAGQALWNTAIIKAGKRGEAEENNQGMAPGLSCRPDWA
jgi:hypothetical protein